MSFYVNFISIGNYFENEKIKKELKEKLKTDHTY